ncbi:MAG: ribonuclease Y [Proteobacteria bacterium]|nr:ribonuclease Y [Pseudomonadota bacterium]
MSTTLSVLAIAAGIALGSFVGNKVGRKNCEKEINAQIGSVKQETERIRSEASTIEQKAKALLEKAEAEAKALLEKAENDARSLTAKANAQAQSLTEKAEANALSISEKAETLAAAKQQDAEKIQADAKAMLEQIENSAQKMHDAKLQEAEIEIQRKTLERQNALDKEEKRRLEGIVQTESRLVKKEELLDKRSETLDTKENELKTVEANIKKAVKQTKKRIKQSEELLESAKQKLEEISGMSSEDAKAMLIESITNDAKLEAAKIARQIEEDATSEAEKRAKMILGVAMQRFAGDYVVERCVRTISLPSDEVKGRIIGREGRNIRSIEAATGVDLIVDDTPETVVISAFDPIRREVAAQTLKRLIADGRIHPGRIEETVTKVKQEIDERIREAGDQAFFELGIQNVDPEIIMMIGRLKYRTSYGQNIWRHSIEAGWLCGIMAAELGLDVKLARRVGLLHDIGKAMDHELEGSHADIGADFLKKHGESPLVCNAVAAHHAEVEPESIYAHLTMAADALSGARPGARREILETYIKRLEDIEKISLSFAGVEKCYAIQAGREIRVLVEPSIIDDEKASVISRDIARRIEQELTYPGRIKVCVIRETRAVETAR